MHYFSNTLGDTPYALHLTPHSMPPAYHLVRQHDSFNEVAHSMPPAYHLVHQHDSFSKLSLRLIQRLCRSSFSSATHLARQCGSLLKPLPKRVIGLLRFLRRSGIIFYKPYKECSNIYFFTKHLCSTFLPLVTKIWHCE